MILEFTTLTVQSIFQSTLLKWSDIDQCQLILTTGGTGFGPRDVTPEVGIALRYMYSDEATGIIGRATGGTGLGSCSPLFRKDCL